MKQPIPILIDTDPGVDDAFCLAFGVAHPEVYTLRGVTTMGGNHHTAVTTRNALALLTLYHAEGIPVAAGAERYLTAPFGEPVAKYHGANGLGDEIIPDAVQTAEPIPGHELIYRTAQVCAGELVVVTVAPETNLALAFEKHPDLPQLIRKIVVMGGSTTEGNVTPFAEANIWHDVPAADIVFRSGVPIDMIGLNLTRQCVVPEDRFAAAAGSCRAEVKRFLQALLRFRGPEPMHDAIAIAALLDDTMVDWQRGTVTVHTAEDEHYGQTVFAPSAEGIMRVAITADAAKYERLLIQTANFFTDTQ